MYPMPLIFGIRFGQFFFSTVLLATTTTTTTVSKVGSFLEPDELLLYSRDAPSLCVFI